MNSLKTLEVGRYGESIACLYLKNKGFSILAQNLRLNGYGTRGEIDILAIKDGVVHVVEVKAACLTGLNRESILPESNLSQIKIRKLRRLRSILLMRMSEGKSLFNDELCVEGLNIFISKVVITGIAVHIFVDANKSNCAGGELKGKHITIRERISSVKVRVFQDL